MKKVLLFLICVSAFQAEAQDTLKISLLFTGDIMQHDSQIHAAFQPDSGRYDYRPCFEPVCETLSAPDLTIGNLELTFGGPPYKGYPQFSAPDELMTALKETGFDVLVTANNHCLDKGSAGLERTIDILNQSQMAHTGTFKDTVEWLNDHPLVVERKGFRFSLLNYTYGTNGMPLTPPNMVNRIDTVRMDMDLEKARSQQTDAIIVFFHWGQEYQRLPNDMQRRLAQYCLDRGARLVIGSHPHVLQPMEWRKEKDQVVAYSLGNFVSGQYDRYKNGGAMLHVDLQKIIKPDGSSSVSITEASYSLAYVYRAADVRRTYYILPVDKFQNDTTFVKRKTSREMLIQFRDDSRELLGKWNVNLFEKGIGKKHN